MNMLTRLTDVILWCCYGVSALLLWLGLSNGHFGLALVSIALALAFGYALRYVVRGHF